MKFSCGCKFNKLDWNNIPEDCPATFDLLGTGLTKGIFQLEGSLGRQWCQKVKPRSIKDVADVISLIRPGCLEAIYREDIDSGKKYSISDTYVKVRNKELEPEYIDDSLEPIMSSTFGVPIYQEQIMEICKQFAGFSLQEADVIRKAVGKKLPEVLAKQRAMFIEHAVKLGRDKAVAEEVFSWIDKFSGYGFNASHAVSYAYTSYRTAYAKVHFPIEFFKAKLADSDSSLDKMEEIKELVFEAKLFNIDVKPPTLSSFSQDFSVISDKTIAFGLSHIKCVGDSAIKTLKKLEGIKTEEEFLSKIFDKTVQHISDNGKKTTGYKRDVIDALIKCGALDYVDNRRGRLLARYRVLFELTDRERAYLIENKKLSESVYDWVTILSDAKIPRPLDKRVVKIKQVIEDMRKIIGDGFKTNLAWEKHYLGMAVSGSEVDMYSSPKADTSCRDFLRLRNNNKCNIAAYIEDLRAFKDKNSNYMAFLKIRDDTYMLDGVVVFASVYEKVSMLLETGNIVLIGGTKRNGSLMVNAVEAI